MSTETRVHGVGDGARWIVEQRERLAGSNFTYLIDLPHLCEYFASAAEGWGQPDKLTRRLKRQIKYSTVLSRLKKELKKRPGHKGLITCIRYLENRPKQFDYPGAIRKNLPIWIRRNSERSPLPDPEAAQASRELVAAVKCCGYC